MKGVEREPTPDQLAAMAYVDGELARESIASFEDRMRREPALALEVAALTRLATIARAAAGPEPMDFEWERIRRSPGHRVGSVLGWTLLAIGAAGVAAVALYFVIQAPMPLVLKAAAGALIAGLAILFVLTLRARLRTLPYDAYTDVKR